MAANQLKQFGQVFELSEKTILKTIFIMHDPTSSSSLIRYMHCQKKCFENYIYHAWIQPAQAVRSDMHCQNKIFKIVLILAANQSVRSGTIIIIIYLQQRIQHIQSPTFIYYLLE